MRISDSFVLISNTTFSPSRPPSSRTPRAKSEKVIFLSVSLIRFFSISTFSGFMALFKLIIQIFCKILRFFHNQILLSNRKQGIHNPINCEASRESQADKKSKNRTKKEHLLVHYCRKILFFWRRRGFLHHDLRLGELSGR